MKCLVITPVGPGHEELADACRQSVRRAVAASTGPFSSILHLVVDDSSGRIGRSAARNHAIGKALEMGADWLFFLDADDLMAEPAFSAVQPYIGGYDAVWGQICEMLPGSDAPRLRPGQVAAISSFDDLLSHPPYLTLQIGHFVRSALAASIGFDQTLDCGEDFAFYCEEWSRGRCIKIGDVLFINRRGRHSQGPRSADGRRWLDTVEALLAGHRAQRLAPGRPDPDEPVMPGPA
ncbi:hypothetical protein TSO221_05515 [Azospirillum sp. TSO22-1]|nr:hypothetical protein TSO221_05515 [Azospirillum sp. TSO22-1]